MKRLPRGPVGIARRPRLRVVLLNGFRLEADGSSADVPISVQRLIVFLALRPQVMQRGYAAGFLWPDVPEHRAMANLRSALWRLRQLGTYVIDAQHGTLGLDPAVSIDLRDAEHLAKRWLAGSGRDDEIEAGVAMLEQDLLPDWYDEWVASEREHFRQLRLHAMEAMTERCLKLGRLSEGLMAALSVVSADPLRETAHRALVRVLLAEGNPGEAVRQVRRYSRLLHKELGVGPSTRLTELLPEGATL